MASSETFETPKDPEFLSRLKGVLATMGIAIGIEEFLKVEHTTESVLMAVGASIMGVLWGADALTGKKRYLLMTIARKIKAVVGGKN